jgi:hypothetical protein
MASSLWVATEILRQSGAWIVDPSQQPGLDFGPYATRWRLWRLKLSFSSNDADLKGGGTLETDIWTNQLILGLSYSFGAAETAALK